MAVAAVVVVALQEEGDTRPTLLVSHRRRWRQPRTRLGARLRTSPGCGGGGGGGGGCGRSPLGERRCRMAGATSVRRRAAPPMHAPTASVLRPAAHYGALGAFHNHMQACPHRGCAPLRAILDICGGRIIATHSVASSHVARRPQEAGRQPAQACRAAAGAGARGATLGPVRLQWWCAPVLLV